jgi:predicted RNA-binding Zn ribbon-like protein
MTAVTSAQHPVDSAGLPLPDASWPDERGAAGGLEIVRRFANTVNREQGGDAWRDVFELRAWLSSEGWEVPIAADRDLVRLRTLRDQVWRAVRAHDLAALAPCVDGLRLVPELRGAEPGSAEPGSTEVRWRGVGSAADVVTAELLMAIHVATLDGSWSRLKACQHCDWLFYDGSRNRSGRWCSMTACGGREKAKAYRRRHRG